MPSKPDNGLAKALAAFDRLKTQPRADLLNAMQQSAEELADGARSLVAEDSGALKDSIAVTPPGGTTPAYSMMGSERGASETRTAQPNEFLITAGNAEANYGHLVEFGTRDTEAQPFMWPAFRLLRRRLLRRIDRAGRKAVRDSWEG